MDDNLFDSDTMQKVGQVVKNRNLILQRAWVEQLACVLETDVLNCAAAMLYLLQQANPADQSVAPAQSNQPIRVSLPGGHELLAIKMLRYRLEVGSKHQLTVDALKDVLVAESGVDRKNIANVNIQADYTLIELPDEMPIDIFQHLKTVEFNEQPLAIKRLKARGKRRNSNRFRRGRQRGAQSDKPKAAVV